jgi:FkbM family methyltransferase
MNFLKRLLIFCQKCFRKMPVCFPGKLRIAKLLFDKADFKDIIIILRAGCSYLVPNIQDPIALHLFVNGVYEPATEKFLSLYLKQDAIFVDVGANIGFFTVTAAKKIGPLGRVLAIEASPSIFPYLANNVSRNKVENVSLYCGAAYKENRESLNFYEAPRGKFGMGSVAPRFHEAPVAIKARKLDDLLIQEKIKRVDVMKVDVEGGELDVFKGAEKLLSRADAPMIIFEFCDWAESGDSGAAQRFLRDLGYSLWRLKDFMNGGSPLEKEIISGYEMLVAVKQADEQGLRQ